MDESRDEEASVVSNRAVIQREKSLLGIREIELANPVQAELFRIFSFYSLHGDASNPDYWRITMLIRFARDCQLLTPDFTGTQLELEVVKMGRKRRENSRRLMGETVQGRAFESNMTILISFADFLSILDILAQKVYPDAPSPQSAYRRLLLENVLLLSNRTIQNMENRVLEEDLNTEEVWKVVRADYSKSLANIFKYYLHVADKRRSQLLAIEALQTGTVDHGNRQQTKSQKAITSAQRDRLRSQKNLISSLEFLEFCRDYNLRSTSLLTSIQVGMAYFECTGFDKETNDVKGMNFDAFSQCIVFMALFAYRDAHHTVTAPNKVKALLLHMWRASGSLEKRSKAAMAKGRDGHSHAGSLNMFGSGTFNDQFIKNWTAEGFPNYSSPVLRKVESGRHVLNRLVKTYSANGGAPASPLKGSDLASESKSGATSTSSLFNSQEIKEDGSGGDDEGVETAKKNILYGFQISALFRTKPELAEMMHLEIEAMKEAEQQSMNA
jgi:hypothetical protein